MEHAMMLTRRVFGSATIAAALATAGLFAPAWANTAIPFSAEAFKAAQASGSPILVEIHADWCPTCKAQMPILDKLTANPKFKDLAEQGRSVGDTKQASIAELLDKSL